MNREPPTIGYQDKRKSPRGEMEERVIIQVHEARIRDSITGDTLSCLTLDRSMQGLRIRCPLALAAGTPLDLWIKVRKQKGTFMLGGYVCWSKADTDNPGYHHIGVEIQSGDLDTWRDFVRHHQAARSHA